MLHSCTGSSRGCVLEVPHKMIERGRPQRVVDYCQIVKHEKREGNPSLHAPLLLYSTILNLGTPN